MKRFIINETLQPTVTW